MREATARAIGILGQKPILAEHLGASPSSPQVTCLAGVRQADAVVLIMGTEYGSPQESGLSATHEEYREARGCKPVLAFIQENIQPAKDQADFISEVQDWERGHYTASFQNADDLQDGVVRGLHDHLMDSASNPINESELADQARRLIPEATHFSRPTLVLATAAGPPHQVIRPAELEGDGLQDFLQREALTGSHSVLDLSVGTARSVRGDTIVLHQPDSGDSVSLSESGCVVVTQQATELDSPLTGIPSIIHEVIVERIARAILLTAQVLDHVDPLQRISHVAIVAALLDAGWLPWRARQEHAGSPNSATMGFQNQHRMTAALSPPTCSRAALIQAAQQLAEDIAVRLRREAGA